MTEKFKDVTVIGHPMLFTCLRIDRDTVPVPLTDKQRFDFESYLLPKLLPKISLEATQTENGSVSI